MEDMEIEVYKSLLEIRVVMGVPRNVLFYTIGIFAAIFALTENLLIIPLWIITNFVEVVFSKKDPQFIPIYIGKLDRNNYFNP